MGCYASSWRAGLSLRAGPSWLWEGAPHPHHMTPGSGACLLRNWEFVAGLSQLPGGEEAPEMTSSFTPQGKTRPICKNPEV